MAQDSGKTKADKKTDKSLAPGRPSSYTPAVHQQIVGLVRLGNYLETAAAAAGRAPNTVRSWLREGERGDARYKSFAADLRTAIAEAEARNVAVIQRAGLTQWQAAAWTLERGPNRERWQAKHVIQMRDLEKTLARVIQIVSDRSPSPEVARSIIQAIEDEVIAPSSMELTRLE